MKSRTYKSFSFLCKHILKLSYNQQTEGVAKLALGTKFDDFCVEVVFRKWTYTAPSGKLGNLPTPKGHLCIGKFPNFPAGAVYFFTTRFARAHRDAWRIKSFAREASLCALCALPKRVVKNKSSFFALANSLTFQWKCYIPNVIHPS